MQWISVTVLLAALVTGLVATIIAPKVWQRILALLLSCVIVFLICDTATVSGKYEVATWSYSRNIQPTGVLWQNVRDNLHQKRYSKAMADIEVIITNWQKINAWPDSYSAADILKEIETNKPANNGVEPIQ